MTPNEAFEKCRCCRWNGEYDDEGYNYNMKAMPCNHENIDTVIWFSHNNIWNECIYYEEAE